MNHYEFDPKMYQTVGTNIKKFREEKGLSIEELSKCTGISEMNILHYEIAEGMPISIYDLYRISVILEVSIEKFFE